MTPEQQDRISQDRALRDSHSRSKLLWHNSKLDRIEISIMDALRAEVPSFELIHCLIGERFNIMSQCKELHSKIYG